ncbi:MAG: YebC/PmpR family DNA-binding transcriptional regulator [Ignavibacteriales bacterium]|nr:YebC/PmpR family DNA-binding transcriptional regulator [Ignavibacteriales bacterium]MCF8305920.1 YebC/PmpR family DNA-binding transcriptional regulator [Ignavibacteriales bacterium]MCF8315642.1 YebC/PmpR family DNA-binding transcriptional regulator [Ignavibacteriales bacterium]MCF8437164.1 YebC/PmpR family DNA-binding transcriptional regulator [Ignavibacteriales bacterium]
MGRIFEKRKHRMFARFAKMSQAFNRVRKEIEIAVKAGGPDVKGNSRLRIAVQNAKAVNMPKDRVDAAIKRASSKDTSGYSEILYEGMGPHGIAFIVDTATDNANRTVANVRHHFRKHGGNLGNTGSVTFMFEHKAFIKIDRTSVEDPESLELELIDAGLEEFNVEEDSCYIYTAFEDFGSMQKALDEKGIEFASAEFQYLATNYKELNEEQQAEVNALIEALEEDEDVQSVFHNMA